MYKNYKSLNWGRDTWFKNGIGDRGGSPPTSSSKRTKQSWLVMLVLFLSIAIGQQMNAQVTTNGSSGLAGSYGSLAAAITALNGATITSPVVITLTASNPQTAPAGGYAITATGTVTNTITINGGSNTITAPAQTAGNLNDAIFKIIGGDYITIQGFTMQERSFTPVSADTTAGTNTMTEFGVALFYATTTNGAQNNTIQNNTISLNRTYQNTFGIYANATHSATVVTTSATATTTAGGNSGLKIYSNAISNVNNGILVLGPTAAADSNTGIDIGGTSSSTANTLTNFGTTGTFSGFANVSGTVYGICVRNSKGFNVSYNSITSSNGGIGLAATLRGVYIVAASNAPTGTFTNIVNNNTIALTHGFSSGTIQGITVETTTGNATSTQNIDNNNFTALGSSVTTSGTITAISNVMANLVNTFSGNTFTNITTNTTGSFTFFGHSYTMPASGSQTISGNSIVGTFSKTGAGGTVTISTSATSSPNGTTHTFTNNNFSNITVTGATGITGVTNTDGSGSSATRTVTGNTFNNWTGGTSSITGLSYSYIGGTTSSISNNTLTNITGQSTIAGIVIGSSASLATTLNVSSNTINNLTSTGTGGAVTGLSCANTSTTININGNVINTLSSTGASAVTAMTISGATTTNVFGNKIYDISGSSASSTVNGILVSGGVTVNTYNNIIGDLRATAANAANPVNGINITGGTTSNVYYNTVRLAGTSSGALFGSSAISVSTSPTVNLRNNVFVNTCTAVGATGFASAYRRSTTTLTSYASTSNNNLFFGSTLYFDGTTAYTTLASYQALVTTRDTASKYQNPTFTSTLGSDSTFLHFTAGSSSLAGAAGSPIAGFTTDFDGQTRDTTAPDMGADEYAVAPGCASNLSPADAATGVLQAPTLSWDATGGATNYDVYVNGTLVSTGQTGTTYAPSTLAAATVHTWKVVPKSGKGTATGCATLSFTTVDAIPTVNAGSLTAFSSTCVGNTSAANSFTINGFNLDSDITLAALSGYSYSATVGGTYTSTLTLSPSSGSITTSVFVKFTPTSAGTFSGNIVISGGGLSAAVNVAASGPGVNPLGGTYTVGAGQTYATLTAAVTAYNTASCFSGNVVFNLMDSGYNASETFPISINSNANSGTYTLTIKPNTTSTISGALASGALIRLNGAKYVTIDGSSSGGTDNSLTITNTSTTAPTAVSFVSLGASLGTINSTIKNCNISTGISTSASYGVAIGGSTPGTAGSDNDTNTVQNNIITVATTGIYAIGNASVSALGMDNLTISGNTITTNTSIATYGIEVGNSLNSSIANNTVSVTSSVAGQPVAISLETGFVSSTVNANTITTSVSSNTGGYAGRGITVGTGTTTSNLTISNNVIYGVNGSNWSSFGNSSAAGILLGELGNGTGLATTVGGVKLYFNTVNMIGSLGSGSTTAITAALYVASTASLLDIRNNIFSNTQVGTATGQKNYAIYSAAANTAFTTIDYNDYFVSNTFNAASAIPGFLGSDRTTLAGIVTGFGQNARSLTSDPLLIAPSGTVTNAYRPNTGSPVLGAGNAVSVTTDYLGATRNSTPSMGAYDSVTPNCTGPAAPTALVFGSTGPGSIAATFTPNGTAPNGYVVVRYPAGSAETAPTNGNSSYVVGGTLGLGTISHILTSSAVGFTATGLSPSTSYDFYIYPYTILNCLGAPAYGTALSGTQSTAACPTIPSTITVGATGDYPSLTELALILNGCAISSPVLVELQSNYSTAGETLPIVFNNNTGSSATNTVTIRPASGAGPFALSGSSTSAMLDLTGARYFTVDGRAGGTGSTSALSITNTGNGAALRLFSDAQNNTIQYVALKASNTSATNGVVRITSTSGTTLANGNSNNTITNCTIDGNGLSPNGIYAAGSTAPADNKSNVISNNSIFNFYSDVTSVRNAGIQIGSGNAVSTGAAWTISGNSFYQTVSRSYANATNVNAVNADGAESGVFTITDNFVGGTQASAGGSALTITGTAAYNFAGIRLFPASTATTTISGNTISNISLSGNASSTLSNGVSVHSGQANITNNTVSAIAVSAAAAGGFSGIHVLGGTSTTATNFNITGNSISGITLGGANASAAIGINSSSVTTVSGTITISNNTIGSSVAPISNSTAGATVGINQINARGATITGNNVSYLTSTSTGTVAQIGCITVNNGVNIIGGSGANGNTISNITSSAANTGTTSSASIVGIAQTSTLAGQVITNNKVSLMSNTGSAAATVNGIYYSGPTTGTNEVSNNYVHTLSSNTAASIINGIQIADSGNATVYNNILRFGLNGTGADVTSNVVFNGINQSSATSNHGIYFNTVYIAGANVGAGANNTFAITSAATSGTRAIRNNILSNLRTNTTGTGKHYSIKVTGLTGLTINNNDYWTGSPSSLLALNNATDATTLAAFQTATSQDGGSISVSPDFISANASAASFNLHITAGVTTALESGAAAIAGIATDYDGDARPGPVGSTFGGASSPDMGADEFDAVPGYTCATLTGLTAVTTNATVCSNTAVLSVSGTINGTGISYQWQVASTQFGTYSNISGATFSTYNVPTTSISNNWYQCIVTCANGPISATAAAVNVTVQGCNYAVTRNTNVTYNSIMSSGSTYTTLSTADDAFTNFVSLAGTTFKYKGQAVTQFFATTNGTMSFSATQNNHTGYGDLTTTTAGKDLMLAPYWTDFVIKGNTTSNRDVSMRYKINGTLGSGTADIIIEWAEMEGFSFTNPNMNFQVVLHEADNSIEFNYGSMLKFDGAVNFTGTFATTCAIGLNGSSPSTNDVSQRLILQNANSTNFGATSVTNLLQTPSCNSQLVFTPAAAYSGGSAPATVPVNNELAGAIDLTVNGAPCTSNCNISYYSLGATASTGTVVCSATTPGTADDDVWFTFTPSASTAAHKIVLTPSFGYDAVLQLIDVTSNTVVQCINAVGIGLSESISSVTLDQAHQYALRIYDAGTGAFGGGEFSICVSEIIDPPTNDEPAGATTLTIGSTCSGTSSELPSTLAATASAGIAVCTATTAGTPDDDVWYKFTTSSTAGLSYTMTATGVSTYNAVLQLFSGTPGSLTSVSCSNSTNNGGVETITSSALTASTTYYLRVYHSGSGFANGNFSICVFVAAPACVTTPIAPLNSATSCLSDSATTLSWAAVTNATAYDVYLDNTGGSSTTPVSADQTGLTYVTPTALAAGTYTWRIVPKNDFGQAASCTNFTFDVLALPAVPTASNSSQCGTGTPTCSVTGASGASTFRWYLVATGGTALAGQTASTLSSYPITVSTDFYVAEVGAGGCDGPRVLVTATIDSAGVATPSTSVTSSTINIGGTVTLNATGTGGAINWYSASFGGTSVSTGASFAQAVSCTAGTFTYYAEETAAPCNSLRAAATYTVRPLITSNPSNALICYSGGSVELSANVTGGSNFVWSPSTGLSSSNTALTTASPTSTTVYTFTCTVAGCGTVTGTVTVGVIDGASFTPTAASSTLCEGGSTILSSNLNTTNFSAACITSPPTALSSVPGNAVTLVAANALVTTSTSPALPSGVTINSTFSLDDNFWGNIPVGFTFNYFGSNVTNVFVSTNGTISLGTSGSTAYTFVGGFPNVANPASTIAVCARDLRYDTGSGAIRYWTEGIAPTRRFVVQYDNVDTYSGSGRQSAEAVFYETTGTVDIRVIEASNGTATTGSASVVRYIGLQDATKLIGATSPNCSTSVANYWNGVEDAITSPQAWRFTPAANYSFQWYLDGDAISGANSGTYTTPTLSAGVKNYTVQATNPNTVCAAIGTVTPTLTVTAAPNAPTSGGDITECANITPVVLSATPPSGAGIFWYTAATGGTAINVTASNTLSRSTPGTYYAESKNTTGGCVSATRTAVVYDTYSVPSAPTVTSPLAYCQNGTSSALSATAAGSNTLVWYTVATGGTGSAIAPTPSTATAGSTTYYVEQVSPQGCISARASIVVNVDAAPSAPSTTANGPYCVSDSATQLSATGTDLKWYTAATGGTADTTAPTPSTSIAGTFVYYVSQTNGSGCESARASISVLVNPTLTASVSVGASTTSACSGGSITFTATPTNGGTPTYQWWLNGSAVSGETASTYVLSTPAENDAVYVVMTSTASPCLAGSPATSNTVTLTASAATPTVSISVAPTSATTGVCPGTELTFSVLSSTNMGGLPSYQWILNGTPISGANNATLVTSALVNASSITLEMTSSLASECLTQASATSGAVVVAINPATSVSAPTSTTACLGSPASFSVTASGTGPFSYQWKRGTTNVGTDSNTLNIASAGAGDVGSYTVVVTGACGNTTSSAATFALKTATSTNNPTAVTQCAGTTANFSVTAAGEGTLTYQWRRNGSNLSNGGGISGADTASLSVANIQSANAGNYSVVVSGECGSATSGNALLTVQPSVAITTPPSSTTLCAGATANFSVAASGLALTYQWMLNGVNISGQTSSTLSISNVQSSNAGSYTVAVGSTCGSTTSSAATLTVNPTTAITTQPASTTVCAGGTAEFTVGTAGVGTITYQWTKDGSNISNGGDISGATSSTLTITNVTDAGNAGVYRVRVSGGTCSAGTITSSAASLSVPQNTVFLTSAEGSNAQTTCSTVAMSAITYGTTTATGATVTGLPNGVTGSWSANVVTISGTPTETGTFNYTVSLTGGCGTVSANGSITVNPLNTITLTSAAGTNSQSMCTASDFATITYGTTAATGATFSGLPAGVTGSWASNVVTISGTPTASGTFNYTVSLTGGCGTVSANGSIVINSTTWTVTSGVGSWSNGAPTASVGAIISGNYAENVDLTACSLIVTNNAVVSVVSGKDFHISGAVNVQTGSSLTVENNANLLQGGTTNVNSGNITAKRINTSMRRLDYTYWSSPTASSTQSYDYSLKGFSPQTISLTSTPNPGASRFYELSESANAFVAVDPLATYFDSSNIAKGFSIRAPNNFPTNGTTGTFNANFVGVPNNGTITIPVTYSGTGKGNNLIGNPYPSAIDAYAFLNYSPDGNAKPNAGTIYFWTHTTQAAGGNNYCSFNLSGGTKASAVTSEDPQVVLEATPQGPVQVGQGFILKKAASSTVVFTNDMRIDNNAVKFFRTATTEKHRIWLNLASETTPLNQMMVGYIEGTTLGFDDSYDGKLLYSGSSLSSLINSENYVIQARPTPFVNTDEVPLNFKADTAGSYTISVDQMDGLFLGEQNVYLRDNLLNVIHNIKASAYTFTSDQGTFGDRFDVVYNDSTLNISTPTFDANSVIVYKNDNKVLNINSGKVVMNNVKIYDARGRLIYEKSNVNSTTAVLNDLKAEQEVLLVKITSEDNKVVTKKVVY